MSNQSTPETRLSSFVHPHSTVRPVLYCITVPSIEFIRRLKSTIGEYCSVVSVQYHILIINVIAPYKLVKMTELMIYDRTVTVLSVQSTAIGFQCTVSVLCCGSRYEVQYCMAFQVIQ